MHQTISNIKTGFRFIAMSAVVLLVAHTVMAVDGIVVKSKASKSSFSNMKKNLTLSLNSGFNYKDNRSFGFKKMGSGDQFSSMITYQKGNITYVLPYRNKALIHRFKTPQKPNN